MTQRSRVGRLAITVLATAVLAACSESSSGSPSPAAPSDTSGSSSATSSDTRSSDVPTVSDPLDVSTLKAEPCSALSPQQVDELGLKPGELGRDGTNCAYDYVDVTGNRVNIRPIKEFSNGLADVYVRKPNLAYFEETQVAGYPAVYTGKYDHRDRGRCTLIVGVTNNVAVNILAQLNGGSDYGRPCEVAELTAKTMINNLKGGA